MDHLQRFGLECDPFRNEPQLEFWFASRPHVAAGRRLRRCVEQGKELCVLLGAVGSGTTTVARALCEQLEPERFEMALLVPLRGVDPDGLRATIARQLGVESPASGRSEGVRELFTHLVAVRESGRRAIVAIDEAHTLGADALAELRALLNLEHDDQRLLTVLLVGAPELAGAIARDASLAGRVELQVTLEPLQPDEAEAYLAHRLEVAGGDPALFDGAVRDALVALASGLPRRLNALADATLFEAHLAGRDRPTPEDVERAAHDLPWAQPTAEATSLAAAIEEIDEIEAAPRAAIAHRDDESLEAASFADAPDVRPVSAVGREPDVESLRDADAGSFAETELPELEPELGDDLARELEQALGGDEDDDEDEERGRDPKFALDYTVRDRAVDASLIRPEDTAPGAWQSPKALDARDDDTTASRRKPLVQHPTSAKTVKAANTVKTEKAAAPNRARELPPLPDEDELDDLFVDLVDEVETDR